MYWKEVYQRDSYHLDQPHPIMRSFIHQAKDEMMRKKPVRIFESGAGSGRNVKYASTVFRDSAEIFATDIIQDAFARLNEEQIQTLVRDMRDCPVGSASITHAISWRALHCLNEKGRSETLDEMRRILEPHGKLLVAVRSQEDLYFGHGDSTEAGTYVVQLQRHMPQGSTHHPEYPGFPWHYYSSRELYNEIEAHGFAVNEIKQFLESPGTFKYSTMTHHYWMVKAELVKKDLVWTGVNLIK
jgi:ubiquinone/menaquinone biosynthesis C-methylase UbiE